MQIFLGQFGIKFRWQIITMKKLIIFALFIGIAFVSCQETPVQKCGVDKLFNKVLVHTRDGLCTRLPCKMKLGDKLKVNIHFTNNGTINKLKSKCVATIFGGELEFPIPNAENGCDQLVNQKCPISPNSAVEMELIVPVQPPSTLELDNEIAKARIGVDVKLTVSLHDENNSMTSCFKFPAKVEL